MSKRDDEAAARFEANMADPSYGAGFGKPVRRKRPGMTSHVPIRFSPETVEIVKHFAEEDGVTVSTWIRNVVARELRLRKPPSAQDITVGYPSVTVASGNVTYRVIAS